MQRGIGRCAGELLFEDRDCFVKPAQMPQRLGAMVGKALQARNERLGLVERCQRLRILALSAQGHRKLQIQLRLETRFFRGGQPSGKRGFSFIGPPCIHQNGAQRQFGMGVARRQLEHMANIFLRLVQLSDPMQQGAQFEKRRLETGPVLHGRAKSHFSLFDLAKPGQGQSQIEREYRFARRGFRGLAEQSRRIHQTPLMHAQGAGDVEQIGIGRQHAAKNRRKRDFRSRMIAVLQRMCRCRQNLLNGR